MTKHDNKPLVKLAPKLTLPSRKSSSRNRAEVSLLTKSLDKWPTDVQLKSIYTSSSLSDYIAYSVRLSCMTLDQQTTLILPAVPNSSKILIDAKKDEVKPAPDGYAAILRKLAASSGIYALASFVSPLIALVLAPFLTHTLSHVEYGVLTVLNTAIALIAGITQFGLGSAFFRAYSVDFEDPQDRLGVLSMIVLLLSLGAIPTAIITFFAAAWLSVLLFGSTMYVDILRIASIVVLMQNLTVPGFSWLRAENKALLFSLLSVANLLVNLGATLLLVGTFHIGLKGALLATCGGYGFVVLCTIPPIIVRAGVRIRSDIAFNLLSFGLPLVSNFVSVWILQLADRYLLSRFSSLAETASYGVSYTLGGVISVLVLSPFVLAWPSALFTIAKRKDAARVFQLIFRWFCIVLLVAGYGLSLLSTAILKIFFPPSYHSAASVIPVVVLSLVFYGIYNVVTVGISVQRKTWFTVAFTSISALLNVVVNIILIPHYGSMGAAAATLVAYAFLALIGYWANHKIYPVPFEVLKFFIALAIGVVFYIGGNIFAQQYSFYTALGINSGACVIYATCLIGVGFLLQRQVKELPQL